VADAMAAAHDAGIVHRDLKPENLFLVGRIDGEGQDGDDVRVVDFGAAKIAGAGRMTKTGIVFGTPHYMSPEQASGQPVDHRADIYALGVIMYEIFSGHLPFQADTFMGVLTQHMFVEPERFAATLAKEPRVLPVFSALEEVTLRAMAKRPELRFQSMQAVADEIDRTLVVGPDGTLALASTWTAPTARRSLRPSASGRPPPRATEKTGLANVLEAPDRSEMHTSVDVSVVPGAFWPRGALLIAVPSLCALVFGGWLFSSRVRATSATLVQPPPAAASSVAASPGSRTQSAIPPPQPMVSVHVTTTPAFAEIWQGDHRVGTAPMDISVLPGASATGYSVRAQGFVDQPLVIDGATGPSMEVGLQKPPTPVAAPPAAAKPKRKTPQSSSHGELIDPFETH
jgi:eukaryotic-like serine/threonine-protein kinase